MRMNNFDIQCYRGETFSLDFNVVNDDGSPYVLPKTDYPYCLLLQIRSNYYAQTNRYVKNIWIDISNHSKFVNTNILPVRDFKEFPPYSPDGVQYENYNPDDAVFYGLENGKLVYKYYDGEGNWLDYEFRIIIQISNAISEEWVEQDYTYDLRLISGELGDDEFLYLPDVTYLIEPSKLIVYASGKIGGIKT